MGRAAPEARDEAPASKSSSNLDLPSHEEVRMEKTDGERP